MDEKKMHDEEKSAEMHRKETLREDSLEQVTGGTANKKTIKEYKEYIIPSDILKNIK